jgi:hypothetical protein
VISLMPRPLQLRGQSSRHPPNMRVGGPQSRSGHDGKEWKKNPSLLLTGTESRSSSPGPSVYTEWATPAHSSSSFSSSSSSSSSSS